MDDEVIAHLRWVLAMTGSPAIRKALQSCLRQRRKIRDERGGRVGG